MRLIVTTETKRTNGERPIDCTLSAMEWICEAPRARGEAEREALSE